MAAGDFGASVILDAQYKLSQMYASPNTAKTSLWAGRAEAARALLTRQTSNSLPVLVGDKIVGAELWFYRSGAADLASGSWPGDNTCTVPTGAEGQTAKVTLNNQILAYATGKVRTNRSTNLIDPATEMAETMADICARLRNQLNRNVIITALEANAQANLDTGMKSTWDPNGSSPRVIVPEDDFKWQNLNEFRIVAKNNHFSNFFFLSGRLFNDDTWLSMLNRMNEGQRAAFLAYDQRELVFDEIDLDSKLGRKSAFAIDTNSYVFWNNYRNNATPHVIEGNSQIFTWAMPDPDGLQYADNGVLKPVVYEFEMEVACVGRDSLDFHQASKNIAGKVIGGFTFAPAGPQGETGVMYFSPQ